MRGLADLLRPAQLDDADGADAGLMVGTIVDVDPVRVTIPSLDGGRTAFRVFSAAGVIGDEVRLTRDEYGELVIVAQPPSSVPVGPAPATYTHDQSAPSASWVIVHNLGHYPHGVMIVDSGGTQVWGQIHHDSVNQLTATFTSAFGGKAYIG